MVISQTPLRISLLGGGTDLKAFYEAEDGCVVSSTIDKYVYVIVKQRFDDRIVLNYSQKEIVKRVDEIRHDLIRESMMKTGTEKGVEITTLADIPSEGSGLGSSSSITVGLLNALYAYEGDQRAAAQLAEEACEIEIDILKRPIGKQDQYAAAFGDLTMFTFTQSEEVKIERLGFTDEKRERLGENLLLFYTNRTRDASTILSEQKSKTRDRLEILRRMKEHALEARAQLIDGSLDRIGHLMKETWECKKQLASRISDSNIDQLSEIAAASGALGSKISGAGGGGFLLVYCPLDRQAKLRGAFSSLRELPFTLERYGSRVIFNAGR
jgi:D-glycero-alpha-D-manno-heptose-7-phosphate kinase